MNTTLSNENEKQIKTGEKYFGVILKSPTEWAYLQAVPKAQLK